MKETNQLTFTGTNTFYSTLREDNQDSTVVYISGLDQDKTYEVRIVAVDGKYETPSELKEITPSGESIQCVWTESNCLI